MIKRDNGVLKTVGKFGYATVYALAAVSLFANAASADPYADGIEFYQQRNFKRAASCFETALVRSAENTNAMYYAGLSYQQLRNNARAIELYQKLATRYPTSRAGVLAIQALRGLGASGGAGGGTASAGSSSVRSYSRSSSGSSGDAEEAGLPAEERLHFKNEAGSHIVVQGQVNNRPVDFVFDTGCDQTVIGMDTLEQLGMSKPTGPPVGKSIGVGNAISDNWRISTTIRVGSIERRNFPLLVSDRTGVPPLLGRNFYSPYQFTIDKNAGTINLVKNSTASSRRTTYASSYNTVPFKRLSGGGILVTAQVNGHPIEMLFDTGAQGCLFSSGHMKQLGIRIPDDAHEDMDRGVGGATRTRKFPINSIRLGPVEKNNIVIGVTDIPFGEPLLGQTFFGDCQYTIDDKASVIHITRR